MRWAFPALLSAVLARSTMLPLEHSQDGHFSQLKLIGRPLAAPRPLVLERAIHGSTDCTTILYTDRDILAALACHDGQVAWRHRLSTGAKVMALQAKDDYLLVTSSKSIALYELQSGKLVWERSSTAPSAVAGFVQHEQSLCVVGRVDDGLFAWQADTGAQLWSTSIDSNEDFHSLAQSRYDQALLLSRQGKHTKAYTVALHDGSLSEIDAGKISAVQSDKSLLVGYADGSAWLVWLDPSDKLWSAQVVDDKLSKPVKIEASIGSQAKLEAYGPEWILVRAALPAVLHLSRQGVRLVHQSSAPSSDETLIGTTAYAASSALLLTTVYANGYQVERSEVVRLTQTGKPQINSYEMAYNAKEQGPVLDVIGLPQTESITVAASGAIQKWQRGLIHVWKREEGLSAIGPLSSGLTHFEPILTAPTALAAAVQSENAAQRIARQFKLLLGLFGSNKGQSSPVSSGKEQLVPRGTIYAASRYGNTFTLRAYDGYLKLVSQRRAETAESKSEVYWTGAKVSQVEGPTSKTLAFSGRSADNKKILDTVDGKQTDGIDPDQLVVSATAVEALGPRAWRFHLPQGYRTITSASARLSAVANLGKVMTDRSSVYKYLASELVAIASYSTETSTLLVQIIDADTGALAWSAYHGNTRSSGITLALSENWLVYSYQPEEAASASRLASVELFSYTHPSTIDTLDSVAKTFAVPFGIASMSITQSRLGITNKNVVAATDTGRVYSIAARLLDPRRPLVPTKADKEAMLIPYDSLLNPDPMSIVSQSLRALGIARIQSVPTRLESTVIFLATGLDLCIGSVSPSGKFDILSPDFNKVQLVLTSLGLLGGIGFARPTLKQRTLRARWYTT
ncbi:hypothetical protein E5Q_05608 [Mixia osmundae IAM 14324]|uniref:ER membrane protein complex subunit 1 n=1 Tax=Mixia osmundae (strain CBS 9802 / IAM 14324 / JCM 22182 / KY 12970) TaxID=764103 RepID=G7E7W0_MIXOS|nr:hypothetical protein E5Q_05608 [Mixia osmundae IAM 14324]